MYRHDCVNLDTNIYYLYLIYYNYDNKYTLKKNFIIFHFKYDDNVLECHYYTISPLTKFMLCAH